MLWGKTMKHVLSMANARMKLLAAAMLVSAAAVAGSAAATTVYGGGATLPAGGYVGWSFLSPVDPAHDRLTLPANVAANSLFGAWAGSTNAVQYCQTGSGVGKRVLIGDATVSAAGVCGNFSGTTATTGFSEPSTAVVQPDFVASDAPLAAAEYSTFVTNKGSTKGEPIQFPAVIGSVAVLYKNSDSAVGSKINLTNAQVCGVFAGTITNWHTINAAFASKTIKVVYRSDGSGTSFSLANHLAASCGLKAPAAHFVTDQTFLTAVAALPIATSANTIGASGNPNVISTVNATDGSIGYAETANTLLHPGPGAAANYATVDSKDPVTDLASSLPVTTVFDRVLGTPSSVDGTATLAVQAPNTTANCLGIVNPVDYATGLIPTGGSSKGYSILAVSYLMGNQKGNGSDLTAVRGLLSTAYGAHTGVTTIGSGTGFAFLTSTGVNAPKVTTCTAI
jgi:ABC-type phosphate transport system substrate-binding protein